MVWRGEEGGKGVLYTNSRAGRQVASSGLANSREQYETVWNSMRQVSAVTVLLSPRWFGPQTEQIT